MIDCYNYIVFIEYLEIKITSSMTISGGSILYLNIIFATKHEKLYFC